MLPGKRRRPHIFRTICFVRACKDCYFHIDLSHPVSCASWTFCLKAANFFSGPSAYSAARLLVPVPNTAGDQRTIPAKASMRLQSQRNWPCQLSQSLTSRLGFYLLASDCLFGASIKLWFAVHKLFICRARRPFRAYNDNTSSNHQSTFSELPSHIRFISKNSPVHWWCGHILRSLRQVIFDAHFSFTATVELPSLK